MASIEYVPGKGYVMKVKGSGLSATPSFDSPTNYVDQYGRPIDPKDAGKEREVVIGSAEHQAMGQSFQDQRNERLGQVEYNPNKDYRSMWSDLAGMGDLAGSNTSWQSAMRSRARDRANGQNSGLSHYEMRAFGADPTMQNKVYQRNNIIENMLQSGVGWDQISQVMQGQLPISDLGSLAPTDWTQQLYSPPKQAGQQSSAASNKAGMLSGLGDMREKIFQSLGMLGKK